MSKCFLNLGKKLAQIRLVIEKTHTLISKMTSLSRRLGYSINQLNCYHVKSQFQDFGNHLCKMDLRQFFSGFRRKHLFISTCIEKQCTRPLSKAVSELPGLNSPALCKATHWNSSKPLSVCASFNRLKIWTPDFSHMRIVVKHMK